MSKTPVTSGSGATPTVAGAGAPGGKTENVKVAIRVRPFNRREKDLKAESVVDVAADGRTISMEDSRAGAAAKDDAKKSFVFDHVYGWDTKQSSVYEDLGRPMVEASLRGYNGTIFAYGQTGTRVI
jgi:hypothetical protein